MLGGNECCKKNIIYNKNNNRYNRCGLLKSRYGGVMFIWRLKWPWATGQGLGSGHIMSHSDIQHSKAIGPYPTSPNANHAFYEHCQFDCLKIWMGKRHKKAHTQCLRLIDFQGVVYEKPTESNNHVGQNAMVSYNVCLIFFHRKWYQSGDSAPSYAPILDDGPEDPCLLSLLQHRRGAAKNSAALGVYC